MSEHGQKWIIPHVGLQFWTLNSEHCQQDTISHMELHFPYIKTPSKDPYSTCTTVPSSEHSQQGLLSHKELHFQILTQIPGAFQSQFVTCIILSPLGITHKLLREARTFKPCPLLLTITVSIVVFNFSVVMCKHRKKHDRIIYKKRSVL